MNTYENKYFSTNNLSHRQLGTKLQDFTLEELMIFVVSVCGALGVLLKVIFTSKCKDINCCCIKCNRDVDAVIAEERLEATGHTGNTPREPETEELFSK